MKPEDILLTETVKVLIAHSCPTLCEPMDGSLPGSSVHGTLQARTLEGVAIFSSRHLPDLGIEPRSPALQSSPTLQADSLPSEPQGKPQEYWSRLPFPSAGDLLDPGIEPGSPAWQADSLPSDQLK